MIETEQTQEPVEMPDEQPVDQAPKPQEPVEDQKADDEGQAEQETAKVPVPESDNDGKNEPQDLQADEALPQEPPESEKNGR